jgi:hypothetical protein
MLTKLDVPSDETEIERGMRKRPPKHRAEPSRTARYEVADERAQLVFRQEERASKHEMGHLQTGCGVAGQSAMHAFREPPGQLGGGEGGAGGPGGGDGGDERPMASKTSSFHILVVRLRIANIPSSSQTEIANPAAWAACTCSLYHDNRPVAADWADVVPNSP